MIPGIFVTNFDLDDGIWKIIDNIPVDPQTIDFPEGLLDSFGKLCLIKGELRITIPKPVSYKDEVGVGLRVKACGAMGQIARFYLNNPKDSPDGPLYTSDLRFNDKRKEVYNLIGKDLGQSYYDMAKDEGFDLARFY